jgi:hypothetical protein
MDSNRNLLVDRMESLIYRLDRAKAALIKEIYEEGRKGWQ